MILKKHLILLSILLSPLASFSQGLTKDELIHLKDQVVVLDSNARYQNIKWDAVIEKVITKKLLLLGEFNHGSKEVFMLRNDLIKSLHNNYGYNVILFESGIGELAAIDLNKDNLNPEQLTSGFFGGWRTKEFQELMAFVKENDINVAGFDVQRTGNNFSQLFTSKEVDRKDSLTIVGLEDRFSKAKGIISNRKSDYNTIRESIQKLIGAYEALKTRFEDDKNKTNSKN